MSVQNTQNADSDNLLKEKEIALKEKEITLKEKELDAKIKLDKKNLWFASPLLIGSITAISGLIGTGIGAVLQGNANFKLERQKFEFTLIQKALESPTQEEAAKQLLFLVNSGVIVSLDSNKLKNIAEKYPDQIPLKAPTTSTSQEIFFKGYSREFGPLSDAQKKEYILVFKSVEKDNNIKDIREVAYILATIKYETGDFRFKSELASGSAYENRSDLGNDKPGDGIRYKGRGYIYIVGKSNYIYLNKALGLIGTDNDIVKNPEKVEEPQIAYLILSHYMKTGSITGMKLRDFITENKTDYKNARKIVSGLDKADLIADYARKFESILRESLSARKKY